MKCLMVAVALTTILPSTRVMAGEDRAEQRRSELSEALGAMSSILQALAEADAAGGGDLAQAAPRLKEMLRSGRAQKDDVALLTRWIFYGEEREVAQGLSEALRSVDLALAGPAGRRWNPAAAAMARLLESALQDAAARRRQDARDWPELRALVAAAAPAVAASLQEADPAAREELQRLLAVAVEVLRATPAGPRTDHP